MQKKMNMMINFVDVTSENRQKHNLHWPWIPDNPCGILVAGGSGSGKRNALLNLINHQPDINKRKEVVLKHLKDPKAFIKYSRNMQNLYDSIADYNSGKKTKQKGLKVFDNVIVDMIYNKNFIF